LRILLVRLGRVILIDGDDPLAPRDRSSGACGGKPKADVDQQPPRATPRRAGDAAARLGGLDVSARPGALPKLRDAIPGQRLS
jgi:hypothetical protein